MGDDSAGLSGWSMSRVCDGGMACLYVIHESSLSDTPLIKVIRERSEIEWVEEHQQKANHFRKDEDAPL